MKQSAFYSVLFLVLCLGCFSGQAQYILQFEQTAGRKKVINVVQDDLLLVQYRGYLGQTERVSGRVMIVTDSSVVVSLTEGFRERYKEVRMLDIVAFSKYSKLRPVLKQVYGLGTAVGTFFLFRNLYDGSDNSFATNFGISLGVGLATYGIGELIFAEKPRYFTDNGWLIRITTKP